MSRFARPRFATPKIPTPPRALAQIVVAAGVVKGLVSLAAKVQGFSLGSFLQSPALAQAKARLASDKMNATKTKLLARTPKPAIPDGIQANPAQLSAYATEAQSLFTAKGDGVDEFGQATRISKA